MIKIIGIGNQLMCDDGIAISVLNEIKDEIYQLSEDIEIIYGETDYMYCLDHIQRKDIIIIMDSSCLGTTPGTIKFVTMDDLPTKHFYSQHQLSLLDLITTYHTDIKINTILIEVHEIKYQYGLSTELSKIFFDVCIDVFHLIKKIIEENEYA